MGLGEGLPETLEWFDDGTAVPVVKPVVKVVKKE